MGWFDGRMVYYVAMDIESALSRAMSLKQRIDHQLALLAEERSRLEIEIQGLQYALARTSDATDTASDFEVHDDKGNALIIEAKSSSANGWSKMARTDAILTMLAQSEPLSPKGLRDKLAGLGRTDTLKAVGGALDYLKRQGRVHRVGYGQWTLIERTSGGSATDNLQSEDALAG